MSNWQERITRETAPTIRVEHELRYRIAAPLICSSAIWADLGCGNGVAAAGALGDRRPPAAVLVDIDTAAVTRAKAELQLDEASALSGDLTDAAMLVQIEERLLAHEGERFVTCFEVVEHLASFVPLLQWSARLADEHGVTFLLSVPNDAFWSVENPHHHTVWSEGAFEQLQTLLPVRRTLLRQVALAGSAAIRWQASSGQDAPVRHEIAVDAGHAGSVATHFLVAFGPRHGAVDEGAAAVQLDALAQRRWERERESNLAIAEEQMRAAVQTVEDQSKTIAEQDAQLKLHVAEFERWRAYIHELEGKLGLPLSGQQDGDAS